MFKPKLPDPVIFLLVLVIAIASVMSGFFSPDITKKPPKNEGLMVLEKKNFLSEKGLQIDTFLFITVTPSPSPTPSPIPQPAPNNPPPEAPVVPVGPNCSNPGQEPCCAANARKTSGCTCKDVEGLECYEPSGCDKNPGGGTCEPKFYEKDKPGYQDHLTDPNCYGWCWAKPVIYLYPTKKTLVDVRLEITGKVVISDPLYPLDGWKNVEAYPDGTLYYQGKKYRELYYETSVDKINPPKNGIVIPLDNLEKELRHATAKIGLNTFEQKEFLDYWVERLNKLNSPYILFSVIDPVEKERTDRIVINPTPQTRIEFLAYFKPLKSPIHIDPLILPKEPPKRIGFTEVEWGGTIDQH